MHFCALRVTETINLKVTDYDPANNFIKCNRIKGGKLNHIIIDDDAVIKALELHLSVNKPIDYLFSHTDDDVKLSYHVRL